MRPMAAILLCLAACAGLPQPDPCLKKALREEKDGWIFIHLEGSPREIGYQHGFLLAEEIAEALRMFAHFLDGSSGKEWMSYRNAAGRMFWPKIEPEYREEIEGMVEGLAARSKKVDAIDIVAVNGWMELAWYYLPYLADKAKPGSLDNKAPGKCSAFIATGSHTEDGQIVVGHNSWFDYIVGERWNVVMDVKPARGHRFIMDTFPGFIHSGSDFVINGAGLIYTETTIGQFKGFDETGVPEFVRARQAAQYAGSIDDFVAILSARNNGAYANTWLVGDTKTGEIAKLDLGLKHQRLWRTKDGVYVGANFGSDEKLLAEETTFDVNDKTSSPNARKRRWEQIMPASKGKINVELAKAFEGDHVDADTGKPAESGCVLCGHVDKDPKGVPAFSWPAYYPAGSVSAKVTTSALARDLKLWAKMGHPCGREFNASAFLAKHPEYKWQEKFLRDMKPHPWTLWGAK